MLFNDDTQFVLWKETCGFSCFHITTLYEPRNVGLVRSADSAIESVI